MQLWCIKAIILLINLEWFDAAARERYDIF